MDVDLHQLFTRAAVEGARHRAAVADRPVHPSPDQGSARCGLRRPATD